MMYFERVSPLQKCQTIKPYGISQLYVFQLAAYNLKELYAFEVTQR